MRRKVKSQKSKVKNGASGVDMAPAGGAGGL